MLVDVVLVGIAAILAILVYLFRRFAGPAILAMMAGVFVARLAAVPFAEWLGERGVTLAAFSLEAAVGVGFILLPFVLAWLGGGKQGGGNRQLVGGIVVGVVGATLISEYIPTIFNDTLIAAARIDNFLVQWHNALLIGGFLFALVDLLLVKRGGGKDEKHHSK